MAESISPVRRTTAHDHKQLAAVLGWTVVQVDKAVVLGVLPPYDLRTPRWRAVTVDALAGRQQALTAALDEGALLTAGEMMSRLGLVGGDWRRGLDAGIIPAPDARGFWSRPVADGLAARSAELKEQIPPQPLGLSRCAALLAELTGLDVTGDDLRWLGKHGHVDVVDYYKEWALYDVAAVRRLGTTPEGRELVAGVVAERIAWLENSITTEDAAQWLEWDRRALERVAAEQGITPGRFRRWAREDIARLAGDEELAERVRRERLLGPDQAAVFMEIRRTDFDYVTAAGWVEPARYATWEVGRVKTVQVPLYRVGDLEDALAMPGVDWEAVHAVKPGEESPLREFTRLPRSRAETVRAFCDQVGSRWQVEVWPHFWNAGDQWEIDWEQRADGHPTKDEVAEALAEHHGASRHAGQHRVVHGGRRRDQARPRLPRTWRGRHLRLRDDRSWRSRDRSRRYRRLHRRDAARHADQPRRRPGRGRRPCRTWHHGRRADGRTLLAGRRPEVPRRRRRQDDPCLQRPVR